MELFSKILLVITLTIAFLSDSYAQERSIGTSWSFSGIGLTYDHQVKETAFVPVSYTHLTLPTSDLV